MKNEQASNPEFVPDEATLAALNFQDACEHSPDDRDEINQAFEKVVILTYPTLRGALAERVGRDEIAIDDILQDTYHKGYKALTRGKFRGDAQVSTWFYRIMLNNLSTYYSKKSRINNVEQLEHELSRHEYPDYRVDIEGEIVSQESTRHIISVINDLNVSSRDKEMWRMRHLQGKTYAEIAIVVGGISAVAAKVAISRLHKKAREAL